MDIKAVLLEEVQSLLTRIHPVASQLLGFCRHGSLTPAERKAICDAHSSIDSCVNLLGLSLLYFIVLYFRRC